MFVLTTKHSVVDRGIAAVLATALVFLAVGASFTAQAAGLEQIRDTISDSAPGVVANHTIEFDMPATGNGIDAVGDEIRITFPAGFDISDIGANDIDVFADGNDDEVTAGNWTAATSGQVLTITSDGSNAPNSDSVAIQIGTHATNGGAGDDQIVNQSATGSYPIQIEIYDGGTTLQDSGETRIVIVDNVIVTADVDTIFDFTINGLGAGVDVNGDTTTATTSTTSIPFGTLIPGTPAIAGQQLNVTTNALNGFTVTVETDQQLTAGNGADINSFTDGTDITATVANTVAWASPGGTLGNDNEYGHWGMTSEDASLSGGDVFGAQEYSAVLTTPQEVLYHTGIADGTVANEGFTQVAYQAEIMSFQEAADDYTATLTYIATPTF